MAAYLEKIPEQRQDTVEEQDLPAPWDAMKRATEKNASGLLLLPCWHSDQDPNIQQKDGQIAQQQG